MCDKLMQSCVKRRPKRPLLEEKHYDFLFLCWVTPKLMPFYDIGQFVCASEQRKGVTWGGLGRPFLFPFIFSVPFL